jgi:hypothetical protein
MPNLAQESLRRVNIVVKTAVGQRCQYHLQVADSIEMLTNARRQGRQVRRETAPGVGAEAGPAIAGAAAAVAANPAAHSASRRATHPLP